MDYNLKLDYMKKELLVIRTTIFTVALRLRVLKSKTGPVVISYCKGS